MDGADGQPRLAPLEKRARAGEGHQCGVQGRRKVVDVRNLLPGGGRRGGGDARSLVDRPCPQLQMQVRTRASPGVLEPLRADRVHLDPVVQTVAYGGLQRQWIGAERVESETQRSRRAQRHPQVLRVLALEVIEGVDRRRVYLHQAQHELGGEAYRAAGLLSAAAPGTRRPAPMDARNSRPGRIPARARPVDPTTCPLYSHYPRRSMTYSPPSMEQALPRMGEAGSPGAEIRAASDLSGAPTCNLRCGREGGQ